MKNNIIKYGWLAVQVILSLSFAYGMWTLARSVNYDLSYEDMVQETVREMVKPEYLK